MIKCWNMTIRAMKYPLFSMFRAFFFDNTLPIDTFLNLKFLHEPHAYHKEGTYCIYQDLIKNGCTIREIIFNILNDNRYLDSAKYNISDELKYDHMNHYLNCIKYGFRQNVSEWRQSNSKLLADPEYLGGKQEMDDKEIAASLYESPLNINGQTIIDGLHRSMCMIGRIISGQPYIPFYFRGKCDVYSRRQVIPNVGYRKEHNSYRLRKIQRGIEKKCFKAIDVGSNYGYFSLNLANIFPNAQIFSVEGSYGTGNKENMGIKKHYEIKNNLFLFNNFLYDTLLSDNLMQEFNNRHIVFDYQISFSVFHWIVYLKYGNNGTAQEIKRMLLSHFKMAKVTFIELPGVVQETSLSPLYDNYGSLEEMFSSFSKTLPMEFTKLGESKWYGNRDLYCIKLLNHQGIEFTLAHIDTILS